ncbi:MAG: single-stranded-DNA-specific exonuclease RecJ [Candidatus Omnitrophica bacterium]|nr:single-stranded-DNA-specific exonuclease RecJ [Candidatus Omnitrophota bacterium]
MRRKIWKIGEYSPDAKRLAAEFDISEVLAQILLNRHVPPEDFPSFLRHSLDDLHSPELLPDIIPAADRIRHAVKEKERVLVVGDYDVDGITSLGIFHQFAKHFPGQFVFYIPHRIEDGYGFGPGALARARAEKASVILTFDCGTNAHREIECARSLGIDVIVVDHHYPRATLPRACAVVNPKRFDSSYPFRELSSGGLAFKFLQVLRGESCTDVLDLVSLSIVCDVVPLHGENRILLTEGLEYLQKSDRLGVKALCAVSKVKQSSISPYHLGFILGPRLNASGRIAHAETSLNIFLTDKEAETRRLAKQLQEYNIRRRGIESEILKQADAQASLRADDHALVLYADGWHPGVLGIVASRLADKYYRPCFVISFEEREGKGSARSIHSVHLTEVLTQCEEFLTNFGGHQRAAGLQIERNNVERFREKVNEVIGSSVDPRDFLPLMEVDLPLSFSSITLALVEELQILKPYGEQMTEPRFVSRGVRKKTAPQKIRNGYSVWLESDGRVFEGLLYDKQQIELIRYGENFDIVYSLAKNSYHNLPRLYLRDCRFSSEEK